MVHVTRPLPPPLFSQLSVPQNCEIKCKIKSMSKDYVIEKFDGKNCNAESWLKLFVKECKSEEHNLRNS